MADRADLRVNRLLSLLPPHELARIAPALEVLECHHHDLIYGIGAEVRVAYFPLSAVMSLIAGDPDGQLVEAASVGREGLVGLPGALGGGGMVGEVVTQVAARSRGSTSPDISMLKQPRSGRLVGRMPPAAAAGAGRAAGGTNSTRSTATRGAGGG